MKVDSEILSPSRSFRFTNFSKTLMLVSGFLQNIFPFTDRETIAEGFTILSSSSIVSKLLKLTDKCVKLEKFSMPDRDVRALFER